MRFVYFILIISIVSYFGCKNGGNDQKSGTSDNTKISGTKVASSNLNDTGTQKLISVITAYYGLKNALVATDSKIAETSSNGLQSVARSMQSYLLQKDSNPGPLKPFLDTIIMQSREIGEVKDNSCEKQRLAFSMISSAIYGLIKTAELKNYSVYHQFCPMAFNEKGATWLSNENEIKNPYFGDKMLECGEVTDTIK